MIFAAPLILLGLLALPLVFILLRLTPPPAQRIRFPPLALLDNLPQEERTPRRPPLWVLLLRLLAAAVFILGLAGPSLHPPAILPGNGPVLLVIDNGWAAAADWPQRQAAANRVIAGLSGHRGIAILTTAPDGGFAAGIQGPVTAAQAGGIIAALQPRPWPVDRAAATRALQGAPQPTRIYIADGITDGPGFAAFMQALHPSRIITSSTMPALLGPPHLAANGDLTAHLISGPDPASLLAQDATGATLARATFTSAGDAVIHLPLPIAAKISVLRVEGPATAGGTALLDGTSHAPLVGLASGSANTSAPFLGTLYFLRRALPAGAQIITGDPASLVQNKVDMIVLADLPLSAAGQTGLAQYISAGGVVARFAGPLTAATPDPFTPDPLLAGDRRLGGALSWTTPLPLAAVSPDSPLAGLPSDPAATVSRQILADPTRLDPTTVWATLKDGTPLVLGTRNGAGYLVSVLTTANGDWSNLALSGLFPALLARLAILGHSTAVAPGARLPLHSALTAFGGLTQAATPGSLSPAAMANTVISPLHPAGYYGVGADSLALNLGGHIPPPVPANLPRAAPLSGQAPPIDFGADFITAALLLLVVDLMASLWLRGLLRRRWALLLGLCLCPVTGHAQPALQTQLGYIRTNDAYTDQISADGLGWLAADVSAHTSAQIAGATGLDPASDDLGFYPLLYWPVLPNAPAPSAAACRALNAYMAHGGLLVIDQPGGDPGTPGSGAGFAPGAAAALTRATACLDRPPLVPLTSADILTRCFYILHDFPGRFAGAPIYTAAASARDSDGVTSIIIGQNDWAGAWARDAEGTPEQTPLPGGEDQRVLAGRFGTNLVIYALTGNYKADQANIPHLLDRLGQ